MADKTLMSKRRLEAAVRAIVMSHGFSEQRRAYGEICNLLADYFADTSCNPPTPNPELNATFEEVFALEQQLEAALENRQIIDIMVIANRMSRRIEAHLDPGMNGYYDAELGREGQG